MLKPIKSLFRKKETTFVCVHWKGFPPLSALSEVNVLELRKRKKITEAEYQRHQIWKKHCGLIGMEFDVCIECPFVRILEPVPNKPPDLVSLDGETRVPAVTSMDMESLGGNRGNMITYIKRKGK